MNKRSIRRLHFDRRLHDRSLTGLLRAFPASIFLIVLIVSCGLVTQGETVAEYAPVLARFGLSYDMLKDERIWHVFTVVFVQATPGIGLTMILLLVSGLFLCELLVGSVRTFVTFFLSDWISSFATAIVLRWLSAFGVERADHAFHIVDAGTSAAGFGVLATAISTLFPGRLARLVYAGMLGISLAMLAGSDFGPAVVHVLAILIGGAFGTWFWRGHDVEDPHASAATYVPVPERSGNAIP